MKNTFKIDMSRFRHLYPFRSHYVDRNGLAYHYVDEGAGEPIVMIHGNPTWSFYYRELIKGLSPHYRTVAPDHIGCGLSQKPGTNQYDYLLKNRIDDIETLMEYLNINQGVTLVVHDWGGMIGMAYALRYPERIARIIMMNTTAFFPPGNRKLPLRLRLVRNFTSFATLAVLGFNLFSFAALFMATRKGLSAEVKNGLRAPYNSWKHRIATLKFVQDIPLSPTDSSYPLVKQVDQNLNRLNHLPMLILWGRHDFVFDDAYLDEWQRRFPQAEVHTFSDAGHYVLEDEPKQILAKVKEFLTRHPLPNKTEQ